MRWRKGRISGPAGDSGREGGKKEGEEGRVAEVERFVIEDHAAGPCEFCAVQYKIQLRYTLVAVVASVGKERKRGKKKRIFAPVRARSRKRVSRPRKGGGKREGRGREGSRSPQVEPPMSNSDPRASRCVLFVTPFGPGEHEKKKKEEEKGKREGER